MKIKRFYGSVRNKAAVAGGLLIGATSQAFAVVDTSGATTAITDAQTAVLSIVAAGGAALIAVALGRVAWTAGAKFVSRLGGRA